MENEVKCVRTLPDDYTPVYLIDRRSPGPMAVILFVAAFFIDILLVAFPIVLGGVEFTLAVPGLIDTPKQLAFLATVLLGMLLMWNLHELVRLICCAVVSKGKRLKYRFRPMAPVASIKEFYWTKKTFYVYLLLPPVLFTAGFFIGMACTGSGPFFWMFLLFQLPSLLACYHPVNDAMALHNLPDNVLIYREGWQMKFYAPEGTKTNIKVYKPKPKKKR